jgi:hypothetical protein
VECASLGYRTRLRRLQILDPPLAKAFRRGGHLATQTPCRKITKGPQVGHRYLKWTRLRQDCIIWTRGKIGKSNRPHEG